MRKTLLPFLALALSTGSALASDVPMPLCPLHIDNAPANGHLTEKQREHALSRLGDGVIVFTSSRLPGQEITLRRLARLNQPAQWVVQGSGQDGQTWSWHKRWGLVPSSSELSPARSEEELMKAITGPQVNRGLDELWAWLTADIPTTGQDRPFVLPDQWNPGHDKLRYRAWEHSGPVPLPTHIDLLERSFVLGADEPRVATTLKIVSAQLRREDDQAPAWSMEGAGTP